MQPLVHVGQYAGRVGEPEVRLPSHAGSSEAPRTTCARLRPPFRAVISRTRSFICHQGLRCDAAFHDLSPELPRSCSPGTIVPTPRATALFAALTRSLSFA